MSFRSEQFGRQVRSRLAARERERLVVEDRTLICSAVLVPLLYKDGEWHVLVTRRTEGVEHHKGQISFPGGACEVGDRDKLATALRETSEEIGLPPVSVEVLGMLDDVITVTGFVITPVVGIIPYPFAYQLNRREVAETVEVPLSFLADPTHLRTDQREWQGQVRKVLLWDYGSHLIWGTTAQILKGLLDLVE